MKSYSNEVAREMSKTINTQPVQKDWGFCFLGLSEMQALKLGYLYRNSPDGFVIERMANFDRFTFTLFNNKAKGMGIDTGR